jgi:hypothetical protein
LAAPDITSSFFALSEHMPLDALFHDPLRGFESISHMQDSSIAGAI